jgi:hypothetical protein
MEMGLVFALLLICLPAAALIGDMRRNDGKMPTS